MPQLRKYQLPEEAGLNLAISMTGESGRRKGRERVVAYLMDTALKEYFGQQTTFSQVPQECMQQLAEVYMRQSGLDGLSVYATANSYVYGFVLSNRVVKEPQVMFIGYRVFEHDIQISFLLGPMTPTGHIVVHAGLSLFITAALAMAIEFKPDRLVLHYSKVFDNREDEIEIDDAFKRLGFSSCLRNDKKAVAKNRPEMPDMFNNCHALHTFNPDGKRISLTVFDNRIVPIEGKITKDFPDLYPP